MTGVTGALSDTLPRGNENYRPGQTTDNHL
jgi:hypothetical protein